MPFYALLVVETEQQAWILKKVKAKIREYKKQEYRIK